MSNRNQVAVCWAVSGFSGNVETNLPRQRWPFMELFIPTDAVHTARHNRIAARWLYGYGDGA